MIRSPSMFPGLWMMQQQQSWSGELSVMFRLPKRGGCRLQHDVRHLSTDIRSTFYAFFERTRELYPNSLRVHSFDFEMHILTQSLLVTKVDPRPWHLCHVLSMWNRLFDCHLEQVVMNSVDVNLIPGSIYFTMVQSGAISSIPMYSASQAWCHQCQPASLQVY